MLETIWFDQLFLGASAISPDGAIYSVDSAEASLNRCMLARSANRFVLADSSKFGTMATYKVAPLNASEGHYRFWVDAALARRTRQIRRRYDDCGSGGQGVSGELILGIDGGGSKVLVALADHSGRILRTSIGGGVNPMDNPNWRQELERHLEPFRHEARLSAVAAALPAYGEVSHLSAQQRDAIDQAFPGIPRQVLNDVDAAHQGAFAGRPGILVLSGTGSMSWARNDQGASTRSGGWGDVIGDEGSSHWIGRQALSLVSQSLDGAARPPTALAAALLDYLCIGPCRSDERTGCMGEARSPIRAPKSQRFRDLSIRLR